MPTDLSGSCWQTPWAGSLQDKPPKTIFPAAAGEFPGLAGGHFQKSLCLRMPWVHQTDLPENTARFQSPPATFTATRSLIRKDNDEK
jgi:hypothetical protein